MYHWRDHEFKNPREFHFHDTKEVIKPTDFIWIYPANDKHGGTIKEKQVLKLGYHIYLTDGSSVYAHSRRKKVYSTEAAAKAQRDIDKAEPAWLRKGVFHIGASRTVANYLSHESGIDAEQIEVRKTEALLHISWVSKKGIMCREKMRCALYDLTPDILAPIVKKMKE